jgi:predicted nucleic acid-binding protein
VIVVVSDTSPIRGLNSLGLLDLLERLYGTVLIPRAVAHELIKPGDGSTPVDLARISSLRIEAVVGSKLLDSLAAQLDPGEAEAIALAVERNASLLLIDERRGLARAAALGLRTTGLVGVLIDAKQQGHLPAIAPLLARLRDQFDFFLSDRVVMHARSIVGE